MDPEPKLNKKSEPDQEKIVMDPQHCYESKSSVYKTMWPKTGGYKAAVTQLMDVIFNFPENTIVSLIHK
jgi:hypothetical protein